jgi:hypothetical protein
MNGLLSDSFTSFFTLLYYTTQPIQLNKAFLYKKTNHTILNGVQINAGYTSANNRVIAVFVTIK